MDFVGMLCGGSMPASPAALPSLANAPGVRERKNCSLVAWWFFANWIRFNDNFLHIPSKTPLQMGCRSRNLICWAAVQKQSGLHALDHLQGRIAAGTLGGG